MVNFLVRHKLLNPSQHGFLKVRSCLTNALCFLKEITKWIDEGSPVDIIYLDFQKTFDKGRVTYIDEKCWTLDKPMASLSTYHLGWQSC